MKNDEEYYLMDFNEIDRFEYIDYSEEIRKFFENFLDVLTLKEFHVITKYYVENYSVKYIANYYNLTTQRIRQIKKSAEEKLLKRKGNNMDLNLKSDFRYLFISDIHGNLKMLKKLLNEVSYNHLNDYLFILGDIIEKGDENLDTLHFVMNLVKNKNTFVICGNCDYLLEELDKLNEEIILYANKRKKSIIWEMLDKLNLKTINKSNLKLLKKTYKEEIKFIKSLKTTLTLDEFIIVHAGLKESNIDYIDKYLNLFKDGFSNTSFLYHKKVIAGHWSTSLYHQEFNLNPHFNHQNNIISIDGSNNIKEYGQLNCLIYQNKTFSFKAVDCLKEKEVKFDQEKTIGPKIIWPYNKIDILKEDDDYIYGKLLSYGERGHNLSNYYQEIVKIPKDFVYEYQSSFYTKEFGNYLLNLKKGNIVKIVCVGKKYSIIKYNGEVGLCLNSVIF